jgi:tRNA threonylcarbamoyl adenosine modification protein YeaZ
MSGEFLMKILALEFSSPQRSVAVTWKDEFHESLSDSSAPLTMIEDALRDAKLEREQIDCLAIGIGPGSYTGVRAAISIAQGWQLARQVKTIGLSSAECIAAQAQAEGATGRVDVIIDAQREELYFATYELTRDTVREIESLKIVTMPEARQRAQAGGVLIGPEVARWFASGKTVFPRAATVGRLALDRTDFIAGEKLEPIYLRETKFVKAPPPRVMPG